MFEWVKTIVLLANLVLFSFQTDIFYKEEKLNIYYGIFWIHEGFSLRSQLKTKIECGSFCATLHDCNAFAHKIEEDGSYKCQIFHIWSLTETKKFSNDDYRKIYVRSGLNLEECDSPEISKADQYINEEDCFSWDADCPNADYSAKWVLKNDKPCTERSKNVWYGRPGKKNQSIEIDLTCERQLKQIKLINHHNKLILTERLWGTKKYVISFKSFGNDWIDIIEEEFADESSKQGNCQIPIRIFEFNPPLRLTHLRFMAVDFHGIGAALQYIEIN